MEDLIEEAPIEEIEALFKKATWAVLNEGWATMEFDDIMQELWVWYYQTETPRQKLANWREWPKVYSYLKVGVRRICGLELQDVRKFRAEFDYSVDVVKQILKREIQGPKAVDDYLDGMDRLYERNWDYWDVLKRRYENGEALSAKKDQNRLHKAHVALTDEMNNAARERKQEWSDQPGETLADGLGRPKLFPPSDDEEQEEPQPVKGYYERRKFDEHE